MIFETFPKAFKFSIRGLSNNVISYDKFRNNSVNVSPHLNFDINTQFPISFADLCIQRIFYHQRIVFL